MPGEKVKVDARVEHAIEKQEKKSYTCPQGQAPGSPQCLVTTRWEDTPVTRYQAEALYAGRPLTVAQFEALTNPDWEKTLKEYDENRSACVAANVPRWVGLALVVGGLAGIALSVGLNDKTPQQIAGFGGAGALGVGIASYTLGYFAFGGARCEPADRMYSTLPSTTHTKVHTQESVEKMKKAAEDFNNR